MATSTITPDQDTIITEIHIAAPPERVFQALLDPQQVVQWWGQAGMYRCTEFTADARRGGKWRSAGQTMDGGAFTVFGEYLEFDPPRLLVYTWVASWTGDAKTTVRWELEPAANGTLVRIRHSGLAARPELAQSYRGWPLILGWIRAYLETGETVESRKAS
ncbi:MAG: SRPBCC domain-containing protein [Candidatus Sulfotelmatobacter sp.]